MGNVAHAERAHARLSASGSSRWLSCPGSVRLEKGIPDQTSSYAEEGTQAHEVAEAKLKAFLEGIVINTNVADSEMDRFTDMYVEAVIERYREAQSVTKDSVMLLEQRLDFSEWVPDGFGTGDVVIIADGTMDIIDLKYGKGVKVEAENNSQLRLYGLGALHAFDYMYDIQKVRMTIIQPRLDHISTEELTVTDLLKWGEEVIKPGAELAASGEGELSAGDHCKFYKARVTCRARAEYNLELIGEEFSTPDTLSNDELAEILQRAKTIQNWVKDIIDYTLDRAVNHGETYLGFKVVEGTARRKYSDVESVATKLLESGYGENAIYKPRELIGLTDMGKLVGTKKLTDLLGDLIVKPQGSPTLVPVSDKRPELSSINSVVSDFANEDF